MEQSPTWKGNRFVASQEIPRVLLNPKVHYRIHNCSPPVSTLSQPNPVHTPTSHFLKINSLAASVSEPALYRLLTFQEPNLMYLFRCLGHTKVSVQVRGNNKVYCTLHCTLTAYYLSLSLSYVWNLRDSDILA
jgi:hypothetical protein